MATKKRTDPAWKYGEEVLPDGGEQKKGYVYIKCKFCLRTITGGVLRMKNHLAGTHANTTPCESAPKEVVKEMKEYLERGKKTKEVRQENFDYLSSRGSYYGGEQEVASRQPTISDRGVRGPMDRFVTSGGSRGDDGMLDDEQHVMSQSAQERRENVCLDIGRFVFENGLPFHIASSPSFANMIRSVGDYGRGLKPPSSYELKTWILTEEVNTTTKMVDEVKKTWPSTGVTIMSDGWTDIKGRSLINFLVNNPEGTVFLKCVDASNEVKDADLLFKLLDEVVEEVGEEHVVQVVTDNASNYKKAGEMLMEKRPHLYWAPCSAHCLDLILEALYQLPQLSRAVMKAKKIANYIYNHGYVLALMRSLTKRELVRPAVTRFATANLTLESLLKSRQELEEMFVSRKWVNSKWGRSKEGKGIRKIVLHDKDFWPSVSYSLMVTKPLVKVLRLVDSEKEPAIGFLYGAIDQAKEEIKSNLDDDISKYKEILDIIDQKWDMRKHQRDLHAAACFLNPQIHYEPGANFNSSVISGLYNCMDRLIVDSEEKDQVHLEIDQFKGKYGMFGRSQAETTRKKRTPCKHLYFSIN